MCMLSLVAIINTTYSQEKKKVQKARELDKKANGRINNID